ncbi:hypothetical protein L960_2759c [Escherichia coli B7A]|nr:hypothetical protein L960_2759c [Escherichia coli B7A]
MRWPAMMRLTCIGILAQFRAPAARLWRTDVLFSHQRFLGHLCRAT